MEDVLTLATTCSARSLAFELAAERVAKGIFAADRLHFEFLDTILDLATGLIRRVFTMPFD